MCSHFLSWTVKSKSITEGVSGKPTNQQKTTRHGTWHHRFKIIMKIHKECTSTRGPSSSYFDRQYFENLSSFHSTKLYVSNRWSCTAKFLNQFIVVAILLTLWNVVFLKKCGGVMSLTASVWCLLRSHRQCNLCTLPRFAGLSFGVYVYVLRTCET